MKIALCYSGMVRNFIDLIPNHKKFLLSQYDCDVYLNFWDIYGTYTPYGINDGIYSKQHIPPTYDTNYISNSHKEQIINELKPINYCFESYSNAKHLFLEKINKYQPDFNIPPNMNNISSMFYKIYQCGEMVKQSNINYDVIIKIRADLTFYDKLIISSIEPNTIYGSSHYSQQGELSDIFFYGDPISMHTAYKMYFKLEDFWDKGHIYKSPENILYNHVFNNYNININFPTPHPPFSIIR